MKKKERRKTIELQYVTPFSKFDPDNSAFLSSLSEQDRVQLTMALLSPQRNTTESPITPKPFLVQDGKPFTVEVKQTSKRRSIVSTPAPLKPINHTQIVQNEK